MAWKFSVGNLGQRAARVPVAVSPAVSDTILPLSHLASGHPDEEGAFQWRSDGNYEADLDLNLLAEESDRSDAPTGWRDLLLALAGTPGLSATPPDWGSYGGRTSLRIFCPQMQEIEVMPGEDMKLEIGLFEPTASDATGARVRVIDTWSGKGWNGSSWADGGVVAEQSIEDAWSDVSEEITADANRLVRSIYRVIIEPIAAAYSSSTYVYFSDNGASGSPALYAKASMAALIGHNLPTDSTVSVGSESVTVSPVSCAVEFTAKFLQTWRLDIAMPSGNQPRPIIGEVWIGLARTLARNPNEGIGLSEGDPFQIRVEGAQGRMEVLTDQAIPIRALRLEMKTLTDGQFEDYRNMLLKASRFGADPILILPADDFDGSGVVLHGRLGPVVAYTVQRPGVRTFTVEFGESPFAGAS